MLYSLTYAANKLKVQYYKVRDLASKNGSLDFTTGRPMLTQEALNALLRDSQLEEIPVPVEDPAALPALPFDEPLCARRDLVAQLPLCGGAIVTPEDVSKALVFGNWRGRVLNNVFRMSLKDWMDLDRWASPLEKNARELQKRLFSAGVPKDAKKKEAWQRLINVADSWARAQLEMRTGIKRAVKLLTPTQFTQEYEGAKLSYRGQPWGHRDLKAVLGDFTVLEVPK